VLVQSVNITIPDFKIYTHKFKEILASDKNDPLSLKRMVKSAKKDDTIFQSLSEPILDGHNEQAVVDMWLWMLGLNTCKEYFERKMCNLVLCLFHSDI
jgi:hypothetical protein